MSCQYYPVKPKHINMDFIDSEWSFLQSSVSHSFNYTKAAKNHVNSTGKVIQVLLEYERKIITLGRDKRIESQTPQFCPLDTKAGS